MKDPSARIVELIEVESIHGKGTHDDPVRTLKTYFWKDGRLLARVDSDFKDGGHVHVPTVQAKRV